MLVVFFRAVILYALVIFALRLMGKRQLGELQPAELCITILISNVASLPIEDSSIPMILGMIPVLVLVAFEIIVSKLSLQSKKLRSVISGKPIIVICNGKIDQAALRKLRFSIDDLMESLRQDGIFDIREVEYAIVETNGKVSVLPKFSSQPVTPQMLKLTGENTSPPAVIVSDGKLIQSALIAYDLEQEWVDGILREKNKTLSDVFLMTADKDKSYYIVEKNR